LELSIIVGLSIMIYSSEWLRDCEAAELLPVHRRPPLPHFFRRGVRRFSRWLELTIDRHRGSFQCIHVERNFSAGVTSQPGVSCPHSTQR
jgi:hypothetical protein